MRGRWYVVKIGGELAYDVPKLSRTVGAAVRAFLDEGVKVCVVHGAGPQASALQKRFGLEPRQVAGQRVTDAETLEVMKMALGGQVSVEVSRAFALSNVPAICTTGVSSSLVTAKKRPPVQVNGFAEPVDYGLVGDIEGVNVQALESLAAAGFVPVLGSLGADTSGQPYNINADTVATRVASALKATRLLLVSNVPGVLKDKSDPSTRIPKLTPVEARAYIAGGQIVGGMIPKVEESLAQLEQGIDAIHIVGLEPESALLDETHQPGSRGTVFVRA